MSNNVMQCNVTHVCICVTLHMSKLLVVGCLVLVGKLLYIACRRMVMWIAICGQCNSKCRHVVGYPSAIDLDFV